MSLHTDLLQWFDTHQRDLPWRRTKDPYAVWVSEVMLQQTQVGTVIPYFERWMVRFPTVAALAGADESEVLELWQGLGYYRRARALLAGAKQIVNRGIPSRASEWLAVPGIGNYTAGAVASIAQGEPVPLVDGNVERVYARLNDDASVSAVLHRSAWQWAAEVVHVERPGDWNQALMELGATVCTPSAPTCGECPVATHCLAFAKGKQHLLPTAVTKVPSKRLVHHIWIPISGEKLGLRRISEGRWWQGMWEFPREETTDELEAILPLTFPQHLGSFSHSVTNHRVRVHVSKVELDKPIATLVWMDRTEVAKAALPAPQRRALGLLDV